MNDFTKVELTQEQYERLKNEYDSRREFRDKHFIQTFQYRRPEGFFLYVGPNERLKEIARLENNAQHNKAKIEALESQVRGFQIALEKAQRPWWKLW